MWRDDLNPAVRLRLQREQQRHRAEEAERNEQERQDRIAARDELHELEADYSRAGLRLSELLRGKPERYRSEQELSWWTLADLLPRIRSAEANYRRLAGLEDNDV